MPKGSITVKGVDDINRILGSIAPRHAINLSRSAVQGVASEIAKDAKKNAPRDKGGLKRAIKSKRRKSPPFRPRSDVIVEHGSQARNDAWYWRFIEFGTLNQREKPFFLPVYNFFKTNIERIYAEQFVEKLLKKLAKEKK